MQVDHTQADVLVVDDLLRRPLGGPWLSLAVDVATRCVVGFYVGMDRPGAATVALLLTRVVLPKAEWLEKLGVQAEWPMHGIPRVLHLDDAAEFKSRALLSGCAEYRIELMYRPVGRPHFGGHIERLNRTLMERVHGLPGSTGSSSKGRKARAPEKQAALTLREFEQWFLQSARPSTMPMGSKRGSLRAMWIYEREGPKCRDHRSNCVRLPGLVLAPMRERVVHMRRPWP